MRNDRRVPRVGRHPDGVERLGDRADLIQLHQQRVADALPDSCFENRGVGDEHVVAHELDARTERAREGFPSLPIALGEAILDRHDGVLRDPVFVQTDHLVGCAIGFARFLERVASAPGPQLAGRDVERDPDIAAG